MPINVSIVCVVGIFEVFAWWARPKVGNVGFVCVFGVSASWESEGPSAQKCRYCLLVGIFEVFACCRLRVFIRQVCM